MPSTFTAFAVVVAAFIVAGVIDLGLRSALSRDTSDFLFPQLEIIFPLLTLTALYMQNVSWTFVHTVLFLAVGAPLALFTLAHDEYISPDLLTIGGAVVGVVASLIPGSIGLTSSITGAVVGLLAYLIVAVVITYVRGSEPMGGGVIKTASFIGAFCGLRGLLLCTVLSLLVYVLILVFVKVRRIRTWGGYVPFVSIQVACGVITILVSSLTFHGFLRTIGPHR
jgi:prepilin signal peptidase PulO-like enzyme (type II secretory pathway)